jgi:NAD(P)-dependent dehydrogenase (short-subunit alcohol dehydrogenase family)
MERLKNKVALVFGAGPNIGGTIAYFLAREGARVMVTDMLEDAARDTVEFIKSRGHEAHASTGSALVEADVARSVDQTVERWGRLDVVVNMAGKIHWGSVIDMDLKEWTEGLVSFPTAGMLTTKHAARAMLQGSHGGSIIHLLSTAAHFGEAGASCYTAAKAALMSLARSAAMDLAHDKIRVNTITPCGMEHNLWTIMRDETLNPDFVPPKRRSWYSRDDFLQSIPLERFPRASDLAWAAVFLASDESSFVTGADIPVDGGLRHKYPAWRPGAQTGINMKDYVRQLRITEYGEEGRKLLT